MDCHDPEEKEHNSVDIISTADIPIVVKGQNKRSQEYSAQEIIGIDCEATECEQQILLECKGIHDEAISEYPLKQSGDNTVDKCVSNSNADSKCINKVYLDACQSGMDKEFKKTDVSMENTDESDPIKTSVKVQTPGLNTEDQYCDHGYVKLKSCLNQKQGKTQAAVTFASTLEDYFEYAVSLTPTDEGSQITHAANINDEISMDAEDDEMSCWNIPNSLDIAPCKKRQRSLEEHLQHAVSPMNGLAQNNDAIKVCVQDISAIDNEFTSNIENRKECELIPLKEEPRETTSSNCISPVISRKGSQLLEIDDGNAISSYGNIINIQEIKVSSESRIAGLSDQIPNLPKNEDNVKEMVALVLHQIVEHISQEQDVAHLHVTNSTNSALSQQTSQDVCPDSETDSIEYAYWPVKVIVKLPEEVDHDEDIHKDNVLNSGTYVCRSDDNVNMFSICQNKNGDEEISRERLNVASSQDVMFEMDSQEVVNEEPKENYFENNSQDGSLRAEKITGQCEQERTNLHERIQSRNQEITGCDVPNKKQLDVIHLHIECRQITKDEIDKDTTVQSTNMSRSSHAKDITQKMEDSKEKECVEVASSQDDMFAEDSEVEVKENFSITNNEEKREEYLTTSLQNSTTDDNHEVVAEHYIIDMSHEYKEDSGARCLNHKVADANSNQLSCEEQGIPSSDRHEAIMQRKGLSSKDNCSFTKDQKDVESLIQEKDDNLQGLRLCQLSSKIATDISSDHLKDQPVQPQISFHQSEKESDNEEHDVHKRITSLSGIPKQSNNLSRDNAFRYYENQQGVLNHHWGEGNCISAIQPKKKTEKCESSILCQSELCSTQPKMAEICMTNYETAVSSEQMDADQTCGGSYKKECRDYQSCKIEEDIEVQMRVHEEFKIDIKEAQLYKQDERNNELVSTNDADKDTLGTTLCEQSENKSPAIQDNTSTTEAAENNNTSVQQPLNTLPVYHSQTSVPPCNLEVPVSTESLDFEIQMPFQCNVQKCSEKQHDLLPLGDEEIKVVHAVPTKKIDKCESSNISQSESCSITTNMAEASAMRITETISSEHEQMNASMTCNARCQKENGDFQSSKIEVAMEVQSIACEELKTDVKKTKLHNKEEGNDELISTDDTDIDTSSKQRAYTSGTTLSESEKKSAAIQDNASATEIAENDNKCAQQPLNTIQAYHSQTNSVPCNFEVPVSTEIVNFEIPFQCNKLKCSEKQQDVLHHGEEIKVVPAVQTKKVDECDRNNFSQSESCSNTTNMTEASTMHIAAAISTEHEQMNAGMTCNAKCKEQDGNIQSTKLEVAIEVQTIECEELKTVVKETKLHNQEEGNDELISTEDTDTSSKQRSQSHISGTTLFESENSLPAIQDNTSTMETTEKDNKCAQQTLDTLPAYRSQQTSVVPCLLEVPMSIESSSVELRIAKPEDVTESTTAELKQATQVDIQDLVEALSQTLDLTLEHFSSSMPEESKTGNNANNNDGLLSDFVKASIVLSQSQSSIIGELSQQDHQVPQGEDDDREVVTKSQATSQKQSLKRLSAYDDMVVPTKAARSDYTEPTCQPISEPVPFQDASMNEGGDQAVPDDIDNKEAAIRQQVNPIAEPDTISLYEDKTTGRKQLYVCDSDIYDQRDVPVCQSVDEFKHAPIGGTTEKVPAIPLSHSASPFGQRPVAKTAFTVIPAGPADKEAQAFRWRYAPSVDFHSESVITEQQPPPLLPQLPPCSRPLRVGLSKRYRARPLHPNWRPPRHLED